MMKIHLLLFILSVEFLSAKDIDTFKVITTTQDTLLLTEIITNDRTTLMYFWATWCKSCGTETPKMIELSKEFPNIQFVPISSATTINKVTNYLTKKDYMLNTYIDYSGSIFSKYSVSSTPTIVIIDKENNIRFNGYKSKRFYKKLLKKILS